MTKLVDNLIALRILKMLVTPFKNTDAYKLGIVDENGKLLRKTTTFTKEQEYDAYDYLTRFVFNIKRLLNKVGKESVLKSLAAALYLIKESSELQDMRLSESEYEQILEDMLCFILENDVCLTEEEAIVGNFLNEEGEGIGAGVTTIDALPKEPNGMETPAIKKKSIAKYTKRGPLRRNKPVEEKTK